MNETRKSCREALAPGRRSAQAARHGEGATMTGLGVLYGVAGLAALVLFVYLLFALIRAEKF